MKCDEMKRHSIRGLMYNGEEIGGGFAYYDADDVDAAIAELKQKLHDAEMQADLAECAVTEYKIDCDKLKAENRRLKRALYKACANWACAKMEYAQFDSNVFMFGATTDEEVSWESMMKKCLKKAEEYK